VSAGAGAGPCARGRFQLVLLPQAGHAVQEDEPVRTAEALLAFVRRYT